MKPPDFETMTDEDYGEKPENVQPLCGWLLL
jgi:hypothetical protein